MRNFAFHSQASWLRINSFIDGNREQIKKIQFQMIINSSKTDKTFLKYYQE